MEGEKEKGEEKEKDDTGQSGEEEEEEEEEGGTRRHKASESDEQDQDLPIMHWEDLSLRIAELEKQEEERRERAKSASGVELLGGSEGRMVERRGGERRERRDSLEDEAHPRNCRVTVITSRFSHHKNLQLCYINNSESDEDDEKTGTGKEGSTGANSNGYHPSGLKQEVTVALRALRDKLWAEQKEKELLTSCTAVTRRRTHLDLCDLQLCSVQHLLSLRVSLGQEVQDLSSELVSHLLERDQLRTKQDAMLLDVQDLT